VFGLELDLDRFMIVAVSDFNMGAMENKGLNIFNTKYVLANPETGTDLDFENVESVVAHEYFHNWTGNRVTCRDWFQLTLKEGLTVFRDQQFTADMMARASDTPAAAASARAVTRIANVRGLRSGSFPRMPAPWPIRSARTATRRSTTSTPPRCIRRGPKSSACCSPCWAPRASAMVWICTSPTMTVRR
jgi:aminopeptidase N